MLAFFAGGLNNATDAFGERHVRRETCVGAKGGDVGFEVHDLSAGVGLAADAERQGRIDGVANRLDVFAQWTCLPAAKRVDGAVAARLSCEHEGAGGIVLVEIVPLLLAGGQAGAFASQERIDRRHDHRLCAIVGAIDRQDTHPDVSHAKLIAAQPSHLACCQLGDAIAAFGARWRVGAQHPVNAAVFCLAARADKCLAAETVGKLDGVEGIVDVCGLCVHVIACVAKRPRPGQVVESVPRPGVRRLEARVVVDGAGRYGGERVLYEAVQPRRVWVG